MNMFTHILVIAKFLIQTNLSISLSSISTSFLLSTISICTCSLVISCLVLAVCKSYANSACATCDRTLQAIRYQNHPTFSQLVATWQHNYRNIPSRDFISTPRGSFASLLKLGLRRHTEQVGYITAGFREIKHNQKQLIRFFSSI